MVGLEKTVEELLEMVGMNLFVYTLLSYIAIHFTSIRLDMGAVESVGTPELVSTSKSFS